MKGIQLKTGRQPVVELVRLVHRAAYLLTRSRVRVTVLAVALGVGDMYAYRLLSVLARLGLTMRRARIGRKVFLYVGAREYRRWLLGLGADAKNVGDAK